MRLIDADQMALDESEAYMAAQVQIQDNVLRGINEIVHRKIQMLLADTPAADVAPVAHGKWVPSEGNPGFLVCSACRDCYVVDEWADGKKWQYCPACGAKMDGKGEEA